MLETLRHIVQEAGNAADLDDALAIIVRWVREAMDVDACAVYLLDPADGHCVLSAAEGLNPQAVGKVRLAPGEGLTGMIIERCEPVTVDNASEHPRFCYVPIIGEERYRAFLGVPIIHYRRVLGTLVVQQRGHRVFDSSHEAFLITVTAQLAGAVSNAAIVGSTSLALGGRPSRPPFVEGLPGAPGVAVGTITLPSPLADLDAVPDHEVQDIAVEESAFMTAVSTVEAELRSGGERIAALLPSETRALFDVYALMLGDDSLIAQTNSRICAGQSAAAALRDTIADITSIFEAMEDDRLRARVEDIRAIGRRILIQLQSDAREPRQYPDLAVLIGDEVSLARIAEVPTKKLAGVVCVKGSILSHTAIVARALGIPAVMGLGEFPAEHLEGRQIIVDGYRGRVFIEPSPSVLREFERLAIGERELAESLKGLRDLPSQTPDGVRVPLHANLGLLSDIVPAQESGADGVGLYRTEFPFMLRESFPTEDEQYRNYREVLESFDPAPVVMRSLDVGGDKPLPYFPIKEENAFLGWRGIRVTLHHPEIFLTQLKAMLRANAGLNNLALLLPMISDPKEVDGACHLLERAYDSLLEEGQPAAKPSLGVMVEVPAAIYQIDDLAKRVDFLSLGTNDLTQYMLAVDRNNPRVAPLYDCLHPAVLRAVYSTIRSANQVGTPISVCGEMAGDPEGALLLLGMGVDALSMTASSVPRIKWVIRSFDRRHASEVVGEALTMTGPNDVRGLLDEVLENAGLGGLIRAGK